jgi:hypothetical protein
MDLKETGTEVSDWLKLYEDRVQWRDLVNTVMNFQAKKARNSLSSRATLCLFLLYAVG